MKTSESDTKVWLITGASSGFGRALAEEAIGRGHRVVVTARNVDPLQELRALAPDRVLPLRLDVTKEAEIHAAASAATTRFGDVDVLVNNAGYSLVGALEETSDDEIRELMNTMFFGPVTLTRALLPRMRARRSGTVVQITSVGGVVTAPGFGPYCAAKHALEAVSEALAAEVSALGIRVLIVEPGAFRTSLFGSAFRAMPSMDAYAASVGPSRTFAAQAHGEQVGDPLKAARAIVDAVVAGAPNLRLPLGADAVESIRKKLAAVASDVDATEKVAAATAVDP